jgi:hypothetical protein
MFCLTSKLHLLWSIPIKPLVNVPRVISSSVCVLQPLAAFNDFN